MTDEELTEIRQRAIRRSRYGMNALAVFDPRVPPEGPFDAAVTNGLLVIVANEHPGEDFKKDDRARSATELLEVLEPFETSGVDIERLQEGIELTQGFRHGRAHEEWVTIGPQHVQAMMDLDTHPSLSVLEKTREVRNVDECLWATFLDEAEEHLPWDPKERYGTPEPDLCDNCHRPTFLADGWDMFGGNDAPGRCIACGYVRTEEVADELAVNRAFHEAVNDPRR